MNSPGARWWKTDNRVIPVGRNNRLTSLGPILAEIGLRKYSAMRFHPSRGHLCKGTFVKPLGSFFRNLPVSLGKICLTQDVTGGIGNTVGLEQYAGGGWKFFELIGNLLQLASVGRVDFEPGIRNLGSG